MCANSTGHAQAFVSASDAAVSQEVTDGKTSIQSACALNTRYLQREYLLGETYSYGAESLSSISILMVNQADGRDGLQIRRVAANILNMQSRTADKGYSCRLGIACGAKKSLS
jgi:hypothetical protein